MPFTLRYGGGEMRKTNPSFLNGVPELLVLKLLSRRPMYGYEIVKAIQTESAEAFNFGEGCIYPYLHHLEREKLVVCQRMEVNGRSRNYYELSPNGHKRLAELSADWSRVADGISLLMGGRYA
jgi:PadR family transcriptional regulator PadR